MYKNNKTAVFALVGDVLFGSVVQAGADEPFEKVWNVHFQTIFGSVRLHAQY